MLLFRYNSTSSTFTVPVGGDGFYYFSVHLVAWLYHTSTFDLKINGQTICSALGEVYHPTLPDVSTASCATVTSATAGEDIYESFNYHHLPLLSITQNYYQSSKYLIYLKSLPS